MDATAASHEDLPPRRSRWSASIRRTHASPNVTYLPIMHNRVVDLDLEREDLRRKRASRRQNGVGAHHAIALRGDERDPRVDQVLLR